MDDTNKLSEEAAESCWSVERHGSGWAIYRGRDQHHHGWNLGQLTECDDKLAAIIEAALNATTPSAQPPTEKRCHWPECVPDDVRAARDQLAARHPSTDAEGGSDGR